MLIYAVGATLSWFLLLLGSLLSHAALLHYQQFHKKHPDKSISKDYKRTWFHAVLCGAAIVARIFGKVIAFMNACWILIWSFLTYTNVMETPYCTTAYFSLGNRGWMRLWNFDLGLFKDIKIQEVQCLVVGAFVAYFSCVLIFALAWEGKRRWYRWFYTTALSVGFLVFVLPLYIHGVRSIESVNSVEGVW